MDNIVDMRDIVKYYKVFNNKIILKDDTYYILQGNRKNKAGLWKCKDCGMMDMVVQSSIKSKKRCTPCKTKNDIILKRKS